MTPADRLQEHIKQSLVRVRGPAIAGGGANRPADVAGWPARVVRGERAAGSIRRPARVVRVGPVRAVGFRVIEAG